MSKEATYTNERLEEIGKIVDRFVTNKNHPNEGKDFPKIAAFLFGLREADEGPISGGQLSRALDLAQSTIASESKEFLKCMADSIYYLVMGLEKEKSMREGVFDI